jgi:hypothetical protein
MRYIPTLAQVKSPHHFFTIKRADVTDSDVINQQKSVMCQSEETSKFGLAAVRRKRVLRTAARH